MDVQIDIKTFDFTRFNHQVEKTQTAGKLLNYYGDLIQRIEYAISTESIVKEIPQRMADVPVFKLLVSNKMYTNIFNIKMNNIHKLAEEFQAGIVYLEKLTLSNTSKWLRKHFKSEIKLFDTTRKEIVVKSYFDLRDKNVPMKYSIIFNFNGVNPENQSKFGEINQLSKEKTDEQGVMDALQAFINITNAPDIKVISKAQLLDLIETELRNKPVLNEEIFTLPKLPETDVLTVGRIHYPQLNMRITGTKSNPEPRERYFIKGQKVKPQGSYSEGGLKTDLVRNIINLLVKWARDNGATDINGAFMTPSVYFTINGKSVRISDHSKPFDGINVIVNYNTDPKQALDAFRVLIEK